MGCRVRRFRLGRRRAKERRDPGLRRGSIGRVSLGKVELFEQVLLFDVRQECDHPTETILRRRAGAKTTRRECSDRRVGVTRFRIRALLAGLVIVQGEHELFEIVYTLGARGGLANPTDGRKRQSDQNGNDGDDDQEFNEAESVAW